jgi:hypothetical protein
MEGAGRTTTGTPTYPMGSFGVPYCAFLDHVRVWLDKLEKMSPPPSLTTPTRPTHSDFLLPSSALRPGSTSTLRRSPRRATTESQQSIDAPSSVLSYEDRDELIRGCEQRHGVVLWRKEEHKNFSQFWKSSEAFNRILARKGKPPPIVWGSKKQDAKWDNFDEGVKYQDGQASLLCKVCDAVIQHPSEKKNGNNGMKDHLSSKGCRLAAKGKGLQQVNLANSFYKQVSLVADQIADQALSNSS